MHDGGSRGVAVQCPSGGQAAAKGGGEGNRDRGARPEKGGVAGQLVAPTTSSNPGPGPAAAGAPGPAWLGGRACPARLPGCHLLHKPARACAASDPTLRMNSPLTTPLPKPHLPQTLEQHAYHPAAFIRLRRLTSGALSRPSALIRSLRARALVGPRTLEPWQCTTT